MEVTHKESKTISRFSVTTFCLMTKNNHPVHWDHTHASRSRFGQILVPGTFVLSIVVGLSVDDVSRDAICALGYSEIEHLAPVYVGDTLYARSVIEREVPRVTTKTRYIQTIGFNQDGMDVIKLKRTVLCDL